MLKIIISLLGIAGGMLLAYLAPEELFFGKKYFLLLQKFLFFASMALLSWFLINAGGYGSMLMGMLLATGTLLAAILLLFFSARPPKFKSILPKNILSKSIFSESIFDPAIFSQAILYFLTVASGAVLSVLELPSHLGLMTLESAAATIIFLAGLPFGTQLWIQVQGHMRKNIINKKYH